MEKGRPFPFVDGRLADVQLSGDASFSAVLPEELFEKPALRFPEQGKRPTDNLGRRSSPAGRWFGSFEFPDHFCFGWHVCFGWRDAQGIPPLLPVARERLRFDTTTDESGQGDAARRVVVLLRLPRGGERHRTKLLVPVEGRPIRRHAPRARATKAGDKTSQPSRTRLN